MAICRFIYVEFATCPPTVPPNMNESNIPIDIHAHKLLEWLISRRHCKKDWMKALSTIREKIRVALQDMPEDECLVELLSRHQLNYFSCRQIVELLKKTEADSKNIFGFYSSKRMKDWQEIVTLYEKDNIYMAEAAQIINRNVSYEVPSLKRQLTKMDNMVDDMKKQQIDCVKRSNQLQSEFSAEIQRLGIKGEVPEKELVSLLDDLPILIQKLHKKVTSLEEVRKLYSHFVSTTCEQERKNICPTIQYLIEKGNTTYFEYIKGIKPDVVENPNIFHLTSQEVCDDVIDFGENEAIDFGDIENGSSSTTTGTGSNSDGFVHINESDASSRKESVDDIDWGNDEDSEENNSKPNIAKGLEALSVLENKKSRDLLSQELKEMEGFLLQRIFESSQTDSGFLEMMMPTVSSSAQLEDLEKMLQQVDSVIVEMSQSQLKILYQMRDNDKFVEKTLKKLNQKKELGEKALVKAENLKQKEREIISEKKQLSDRMPALISVTRELESHLEEAISNRYKNRPVNIMAGSRLL